MKTSVKTLKENGLKVVNLTASKEGVSFYSSLTNRPSKNLKALANSKNELLHIDGEVYTPLGGALAFAELIPFLKNEGFEFKKLDNNNLKFS